jgi:hypothetical protein
MRSRVLFSGMPQHDRKIWGCVSKPDKHEMEERINKLYKPAELEAAQKALVNSARIINYHEASRILVALHKLGFRIVHVGSDDK